MNLFKSIFKKQNKHSLGWANMYVTQDGHIKLGGGKLYPTQKEAVNVKSNKAASKFICTIEVFSTDDYRGLVK